jgi:hypothetical protein
VSELVSVAPLALRTLVSGVVDYAGLFPPASLDMPAAVANYAEYRASDDAWMLGRFVVPVARLAEWELAVADLSEAHRLAWNRARISALLSGEYARECDQIAAFNARAPFGVCTDAAEGRTATPDDVLAVAAAMPDDVMLYCEIPHRDDPLPHLLAVRAAKVCAKIRTGGVTPDAFPSAAEIVRFLRRCAECGVTAKATAGLHHPMLGKFRLTYAPDSVRGKMYGYLNLFLCAAAVMDGATDAVATAILLLDNASAIELFDGAVRLRYTSGDSAAQFVEISETTIARMRERGVVAFGSCSFREPVDDLRAVIAAHAL